MKLFDKKPDERDWSDRSNYGGGPDEQMKTVLVAVIVGAVVLIALMISIKFIKDGKNPFGETASSGKTVTTGSASADAGEEAYSGDETESSGTETEDTSVSDAQQQEPQEETAEAVPAVTPEENTQENTQESAQESLSFEDACMVCIDRRITDEDIDAIYSTAPSGLPETPIQMAINYVYAWHGYHFKTDEIRAYFQALDWYRDQGKSIDQVNAAMNAVQKDNVKKLVELR